MGDLDVTLIGRGFAENGDVRRVYFGREDRADFDRTLALELGDFRVEGDREIVLRRVENLTAGNYYVYVEHPLRGIARSPHAITVGRSLTYKFGDFTRFWEATWQTLFPRSFTLDIGTIVLALIMVFCAALFLFTLKGTAIAVTESRALRGETRALLYGNEMPMAKKQKLTAFKRRGAGLRLKISLFTGALVTLVVLMVSTPLYLVMGANQRATLMRSLWDRSAVLLDSVSAGARTFLPLGDDGRPNLLELGFLPAQSAAIPEANYVTITGFSARPSLTADTVWATNDQAIASKINTTSFEAGVSRIEDAVSERINALQEERNDRAREAAGALAESVAELNREAVRLLSEDSDTARSQLERIQASAAEMNARITASFAEIGAQVYSEPAFDVNARKIHDTDYTLFKPVLFRQGDSDIYVRGWIRLEISSSRIVHSIAEGERAILTLIFFIALAAVLLGGALSFILATFIILPIRSLVRHVEMIRDTEDKTQLAGMSIAKKSSDEIGVLSETINEMTDRLVQAALASQDLSIGKEIQKKFIPLALDIRGNKLTTGYKDTPYA